MYKIGEDIFMVHEDEAPVNQMEAHCMLAGGSEVITLLLFLLKGSWEEGKQ